MNVDRSRMNKVVNWTSATVPMWQIDCQNFWRAGLPFEIRDICKDEDIRFIETFATSHNLSYKRQGTTVLFPAAPFVQSEVIPPNSKATTPG